MTFLPIVERELRAAARLPATYRNRWLGAGVVTFVAVIMMLFAGWTMAPSMMGGAMFGTLAYLALAFCLLEGVRKTADCLSEEKREGTLGLLFLTDLKGYDVVLGKLAATSLNSIYGLVSILPVLALPLLVGGVTMEEYWRMVFALLNILFFSLCAGMCVSSFSVREQQATGWTCLLIAVIAILPWFTFNHALALLSPMHAFQSAFEYRHRSEAGEYWESLGGTQLWSWLFLLAAAIKLPRSWQQGEGRAFWQSARSRSPEDRAHRERMRAEMLASNPITWLAWREQGGRGSTMALMIVVALGSAVFIAAHNLNFLPLFISGALLVNLILKMRIAAQAVHFLAEARRNNALEILLATPLTVEQYMSGQIEALKRLYFMPAVGIIFIEYMGGIIGAAFSTTNGSGSGDAIALLSCAGFAYTLFAIVDVSAVIYTGMWFGLTSKNENKAATKTIFFVLVLPLIALLFWCPGYLFFIACPIFWSLWSRSRVYGKLREAAGPKYGLVPVTALPGPPPAPSPPRIKPPIIT